VVLIIATWSDRSIEAIPSRLRRYAFLLHFMLCVGKLIAAGWHQR